MDVNKVLCLDVLGSKFSKMHFIKPKLRSQYDEALFEYDYSHNTIRFGQPIETNSKSNKDNGNQQFPFSRRNIQPSSWVGPCPTWTKSF